jgi:hypothetical protein
MPGELVSRSPSSVRGARFLVNALRPCSTPVGWAGAPVVSDTGRDSKQQNLLQLGGCRVWTLPLSIALGGAEVGGHPAEFLLLRAWPAAEDTHLAGQN